MARRPPFWRGPAVPRTDGPAWEDVPSNRVWLDELEAAIDAGDDDRIVAAQAVLRMSSQDRANVPVLRARAPQVPVSPAPAGVEQDQQEGPVTVAGPARRLTGAYARRAMKEAG